MSTDTSTLTILDLLFGITLATMFFAMIFFVLFGQITMRKLRKNPETKQAMGIELTSGWDILNVAGALTRPKWLNRKLEDSALGGFMYPNSETLFKNTNLFDQILAKMLYLSYVYTGSSAILLGVLNLFGAFN